jgi:hypothetical protein
VSRDIPLRSLLLDRLVLEIHGKRDVAYGVVRQGRAAREVRHTFHVRRAHHPRVIPGDIREELVEFDVLLRVGADEIVVRKACNSEHRLAVKLRVVQTIQKMDAARARCRQAHTDLAGELRVAAGHEGCGLFMPDLDESNLLLARPQRLHDAVDAVTGQAEDDLDSPFHQHFDKTVGCSHAHESASGARNISRSTGKH